eukprot:3895408-Amphidinium_carterae.1
MIIIIIIIIITFVSLVMCTGQSRIVKCSLASIPTFESCSSSRRCAAKVVFPPMDYRPEARSQTGISARHTHSNRIVCPVPM